MELLDRYLQAVKKHLPLKRQDDIIANRQRHDQRKCAFTRNEADAAGDRGGYIPWKFRIAGTRVSVVNTEHAPQQFRCAAAKQSADPDHLALFARQRAAGE